MATCVIITLVFLFSFLVRPTVGGVLFSSLPRTLNVHTSTEHKAILKAGEDNITVVWALNETFPEGIDDAYELVQLKLCYAPISQHDRPWRKPKDDLGMDKACKFDIIFKPYSKNNEEIFDWTIKRNVPTAVYFVRAYAYNSSGEEVAFGQTYDDHKTGKLVKVRGVPEQYLSVEIADLNLALVCFFVFCFGSLFGLFKV